MQRLPGLRAEIAHVGHGGAILRRPGRHQRQESDPSILAHHAVEHAPERLRHRGGIDPGRRAEESHDLMQSDHDTAARICVQAVGELKDRLLIAGLEQRVPGWGLDQGHDRRHESAREAGGEVFVADARFVIRRQVRGADVPRPHARHRHDQEREHDRGDRERDPGPAHHALHP